MRDGIVTTADDVVSTFSVTPVARQAFHRWHKQPSQAHVVDIVMQHVSAKVYCIRLYDVQTVAQQTEHALGDVSRVEAESLPSIVDWRPDFAFTHVFHYALEKLGAVFTFQQFRDFSATNGTARSMLFEPAQRTIQAAIAGGADTRIAHNAMRWRVGNAYYSFLRELYVIVAMRDEGLDLRVHPLADALFRVDGWANRCILVLYVENAKFRSGSLGRKPRPEDLLDKANPPFDFVPIRLSATSKFGRLHVPSLDQIRVAVEKFRTTLDP